MNEDRADQAARWFVASHGDDMDWDAFTEWLEADPRHRAEYDAIALLDGDIDRHAPAIEPLVAPAPAAAPAAAAAPRRRLLRTAAGIAAVFAVVLAFAMLPLLRGPAGRDVIFRAPPDRNRDVAINDVHIALAAGSVLTEVGGDPATLRLDGGGYFDVPHRPGRALAISAGDYTVRDIGTRFEIFATPRSFRVAVAAGQVTVASARLDAPVALSAGKRFTVSGSDDAAELATIAPGDVARWRTGQLVYDAAPLALVAAEISRYAGEPVTVDPALADRRFSGTLTIGDGSHLAQTLAEAAGLRLDHAGGALRLAAASRS
jgi:transmembrane sensor